MTTTPRPGTAAEVRPQPMITCRSVSASSEWYRRALGFESGHGGDEYEMLMSGGTLVLQLHEIDAHEHPHLIRDGSEVGNGVAVWFETALYAAAVARIEAADAEVLEGDHVNELAHHREIWLRDPDGYVVVVSSPYGDVG